MIVCHVHNKINYVPCVIFFVLNYPAVVVSVVLQNGKLGLSNIHQEEKRDRHRNLE